MKIILVLKVKYGLVFMEKYFSDFHIQVAPMWLEAKIGKNEGCLLSLWLRKMRISKHSLKIADFFCKILFRARYNNSFWIGTYFSVKKVFKEKKTFWQIVVQFLFKNEVFS